MRGQTAGQYQWQLGWPKKLQAGGESEVCCPYIEVTIAGAAGFAGYETCPNCGIINGTWICTAISPCEWVYEGTVDSCYILVWVIRSTTYLSVWVAVGPTSSNTVCYGYYREGNPAKPCSSFNENLSGISTYCFPGYGWGTCHLGIPA